MVVLSEYGLYFFLNRSDKPRAIPFQKKVCGEILPAIRKTGRYETPSAPAPQAPTEATEALSLRDLEAVKRVVWFIGHHFRFTEVWTQGVWHYLRLALGNPAPRPFAVVQMPHIAHELACIAASANAVHDLMAHIEREAARRILRKGEATDLVLADLRRKADAQLALLAAGPQPAVPLWLQHDIAALTNRTQRVVMDHPECNEQPDFFKPAAQPSTATV